MQNNNNTTTSTVASVDTNSWSSIAEHVLTALGGAAHHTKMVAYIAEHKLNPLGIDIATKVWSDCKKHGDGSKFRFLKHGCFSLASHPAMSEDQVKALCPPRVTAAPVETVELVQKRIETLEANLKAARARLAELKAAQK